MINRRTFGALLAGAVAAPRNAWSQSVTAKTVYYAGVGPDLSLYDIDVAEAALQKRSTVTLPANVQYAWPHPSKRYLYVVSSSGGPGVAGDKHVANAFHVDPASGALAPHGEPQMLPSRPIHTSVDRSGEYLLTAYNNPSNVTVHRIKADGTLGDQVNQPGKVDTGIYGHQVLMTPGNQTAIFVARGNNAAAGKPEDPGALKVFGFKNGALSDIASIAPGTGPDTGLGFGPRHLDFHPTQPWVYVSIERQNKLSVYKLAARADEPGSGRVSSARSQHQPAKTGVSALMSSDALCARTSKELPRWPLASLASAADGTLGRDPIFVKETLADPGNVKPAQGAGPIHVHPNGRFVYVTNRNQGEVDFEGKKIFNGGENNVAVFAIDQQSGEPALIQTIDGRGIHLRNFGIDPGGRLLVASSIRPMPVRDGSQIKTLTAGLMVYRVGGDGKLEFARKYDIDTGNGQQFWSGMVTLA